MLTVMVCAGASVFSTVSPKAMLVGLTLIAGFTPVPVTKSDTTGGELLLETLSEPLRVPIAVGWKVTWMAQLLPTARLAGQVLVWVKSPLTDTPEMLRGSVPVLESVTVWAALPVFNCWFPKLRPEGESDPTGSMPVPDRATVVGVVGALLPILSVAEAAPVERGVNPTSMVQLPAGGTAAVQLLRITFKSGSPLTRVEEMSSVALPVFVTVIVWSGALVFIDWPPKLTLAGLTLIAGCVPVPLNETGSTGCALLLETVRLPLRTPVAVGLKTTCIEQLVPAFIPAGATGQLLL